ncbi:hypothetical protein EG328_001510 [Venturia inaequalis]|uniref:C2H2-type domain-containing protein n=1 Tax=Venturia inaequalis TaxID=5025 RepID=A0A8H3V812_VENIN|nr:hypothetical protein EG328_001510 [Venturia inaequalis]KAE9982717.1 hypothetical protein EG327_005769 [Venturia inaequalis]RDI89000.1 Cytochrome P450 52A13 [Venturia inaequalis]
MNSDAPSLTISSRNGGINGQHRQLWLRGHSCAPSIDSVQNGSASRRPSESRASVVSEFEYVCPHARCAQSFITISRLQQHYTERHASRVGAFDNPMTEPSYAQLGLQRHHETPPRLPQSRSAIKSLISLPSSTSSGSSAECDSDSDFTDEEDGVGGSSRHEVSSSVKKMIKYLLCKVQWHLYSSSVIHCASPSLATSDPTAIGDPAAYLDSPSLSARSKRRASIHSELEMNDDEHPKKRRKVKTCGNADSIILCRFACPFYKHDSQRYGSRRSCSGPGWPTVHKMKEHLYRAHAEPIQCPRCYVVVDTDADLRDHIRGEPCLVAKPQLMEGITREQLKTLRKRAAPCRLEEDKWMDIYRLQFPSVLTADLPSPYYDREMPTERSRQFRRDLLKSIRSELFSAARRATGQVEEHLLQIVAGIIQQCQRQLISSRKATVKTTPDQKPQMSPRQHSVTIGSHPPEYHKPPLLQNGLLDSDIFFPGFTNDELYHVDWNTLFADPLNDIPSLSSAIANSQLLSHSSTSREVQMSG